MGSPASPITTILYMGYIEEKALREAQNQPRLWRRYVDDTLVVQQLQHNENLLTYYQHRSIHQFHCRGHKPFLDTFDMLEPNRTVSITVYRKATHMGQYIHWDSHHHTVAKYSLIKTLCHRSKAVRSTPELLRQKTEQLSEVLTRCRYAHDTGQDGMQKASNKLMLSTISAVTKTTTTIIKDPMDT